MLQPPVTEVSCGLRCMRAARCVAASESKKNAACLHRCNLTWEPKPQTVPRRPFRRHWEFVSA